MPCDVTFAAEMVNDPLANSGITYQWTITPPSDRPSAVFAPVSGGNSGSETFSPPVRPASSAEDYIVTVVATGNEHGNVGMATMTIRVRLLGDTDDSGCVDQADFDFVFSVEEGNISDPEMIQRADVNCDGTTNFLLDRSLILFVQSNPVGQGNGSCNP